MRRLLSLLLLIFLLAACAPVPTPAPPLTPTATLTPAPTSTPTETPIPTPTEAPVIKVDWADKFTLDRSVVPVVPESEVANGNLAAAEKAQIKKDLLEQGYEFNPDGSFKINEDGTVGPDKIVPVKPGEFFVETDTVNVHDHLFLNLYGFGA